MHIAKNADGTYATSPKLWTSQRPGGCSVELMSLIKRKTDTASRVVANNGVTGAVLNVKEIRATMNRWDPKAKKTSEALGIAYTPIQRGEPFGPNPFHCDIFPPLANHGSKTLARRATLVDQNVARLYWEKHYGA
jgi:hypothetical protein